MYAVAGLYKNYDVRFYQHENFFSGFIGNNQIKVCYSLAFILLLKIFDLRRQLDILIKNSVILRNIAFKNPRKKFLYTFWSILLSILFWSICSRIR